MINRHASLRPSLCPLTDLDPRAPLVRWAELSANNCPRPSPPPYLAPPNSGIRRVPPSSARYETYHSTGARSEGVPPIQLLDKCPLGATLAPILHGTALFRNPLDLGDGLFLLFPPPPTGRPPRRFRSRPPRLV